MPKHQGFCANGKRLFLKHKRNQKEQKGQKRPPSARTFYSKTTQSGLSLDFLLLLCTKPKVAEYKHALNRVG
jgi:hypothetical protein